MKLNIGSVNWLKETVGNAQAALQYLKEVSLSRSSRAKLRRLLNGKSVALVGPAPMSREYGYEIDASEFVVRVGYEHWPWPGTGQKIDAWVFDRGMSEKLIRNPDLAPDVRWLFLKSGSSFSLASAIRMHRLIRRGGSDVLFLKLPSGRELKNTFDIDHKSLNPNQIPMMLFELAGAAPLSVAVYGSDFYLGRQIYDRSSPDSISVKENRGEFLRNMFRSHNQSAQFKICKGIFENKDWSVLGSDEFIQIMKFSEQQFNDVHSRVISGLDE